MMKRILTWILAGGLLLLTAGCQSAPPDQETIRATAEQSVNEMAAGQFDRVVERMDAACRKALPANVLKQAWDSVTEPVGAYQEQTNLTVNLDGEVSAVVTCRFTAKEVLVTLRFDQKAQIKGIWLNYGKLADVPLAESDLYAEQAIEIGNGAEKLRGRLTLPKGVEQPPVVVMVQGSGSHDMDETIGKAGNQPFRDLALGLAERGIATIRFDKRYFDYPEQAAAVADTITIEDEVIHDVVAAIELAEVDERVDNQQIYLLGHSLGGMLAPKIAFDNPSIKGIISLAGSLRGLEDISLDQNEAALRASGLSEAEQQKQLEAVRAEVEKIKSLTEAKKGQTILGQPTSYWLSLNRARGDLYASRLQIPMLILQGQADFQVSVERDFQSWQDALGYKTGVTYWAYGGLNHLFMQSSGKQDLTDYDTPGHVEPKVLDDIADWVVETSSESAKQST